MPRRSAHSQTRSNSTAPLQRWSRASLVAALLLLNLASTLHAGSVATDGSLGPAQTITPTGGVLFTIPQSLGRTAGTNLFHSLSQLNLDAGQTASFTGSSSIQNVFTRVTGGASTINGTIQCTIPGANFYLINSAGVVFGPGAALDVSGAFAVTTADYVKLADGTQFMAMPSPSDAVLSTAAPAAYGFLATHPAAISASGTTLSVQSGQSLTLAGGGVTLSTVQLVASGGQVSIVSTASPGHARLAAAPAPPDVSSFSQLGPVTLTSSTISTDGPAGGAIVVRAGSLAMTSSSLTAQTTGAGNGIGIDVGLTGNLDGTNSSLVTSTSGSGNAGGVTLTADQITLSGFDSSLQSIFTRSLSTSPGAGNAGPVNITANSLTMSDLAGISVKTFGSGAGGDVTLSLGSLAMSSGSVIDANTNGTGPGGSVSATVSGAVIFDGGSVDTVGIGANTLQTTAGAGNGGTINLSAGSLMLLNGGVVEAISFGAGDGGDVNVQVAGATTINATVAGNVFTAISGQTNLATSGAGHGGNVTVSSGSLSLLNGGDIDATTFGPGRGGDVNVRVAGALKIDAGTTDTFTGISAQSRLATAGGGSGGSAVVNAGTLHIDNGALISSTTFGTGNGGDIRVHITNGATLDAGGNTSGGGISAESNATLAGAGNSGNVIFSAANLNILNGAEIDATTFGPGSAGNASISVPGAITIDAGTTGRFTGISSETRQTTGGAGAGGDVTLRAGSLSLLNGGEIDASTFGTGNAGSINATASGNVRIDAGTTGAFTALSSESQMTTAGAGNGGDVTLNAGSLQVLNHGQIDASTFGPGNGGSIFVTVSGDTTVDAGTTGLFTAIAAQTNLTASGGGHSGDVTLNTNSLEVRNGGEVDATTFGSGDGGSVILTATGPVTLDQGTSGRFTGISSETKLNASNAGNGGSVNLTAASLTVLNGAVVDTSTFGTGAGGDVQLNVAGLITLNNPNSSIAAGTNLTTAGAGRGGNIRVAAGSLNILGGAFIDADSFGTGNSGAVTLNIAGTLVINGQNQSNNSTYVSADTNLATAGGGSSGDVTVTAGSIRILKGGDIDADTFGSGNAGSVSIRTGSLTVDAGTSGQLTYISSESAPALTAGGNGGNVDIKATTIDLLNGGEIDATTIGPGAGGSIHVRASSLDIMPGSYISADAQASGDGGIVLVNVSGLLKLDAGGASGNSTISAETSQTSTGGGRAGNVAVTAGQLQLLDGASVEATSFGTGAVGNVNVSAGSLELLGGGILAEALASGAPGSININVTGTATLQALGSLQSVISATSFSTQTTATPGSVSVTAATLNAIQGGFIDASTLGPGQGGDVTINAGSILLDAMNSTLPTGILARTFDTQSGGNGGRILISGSNLTVQNGALISTKSSGTGSAGNLIVSEGSIRMNSGVMNSNASGPGNAGTLTIITTGDLSMSQSRLLVSSKQSLGGNMTITAGGNIVLDQSQISAKADESDAGSIVLRSPGLIELFSSELTTSAQGAGGNITIDPSYVILDDSSVVARAVQLSGGNITIAPDVLLASTDSVVSASSQEGVSGTVQETTPDQQLAGQLVALPESLYSVAAALQDICAVKLGGDFSSFISTGRGGLPLEPGGWLPSIDFLPAATSPSIAPSHEMSPPTRPVTAPGDGARAPGSNALPPP